MAMLFVPGPVRQKDALIGEHRNYGDDCDDHDERIQPDMPKWLWGVISISVSIASIRETANTLASRPDAVATTTSVIVKQKP
tara:strand:- start:133 stop:378 length:246 start_codon:yes stop_codon:yes gene_type:complete